MDDEGVGAGGFHGRSETGQRLLGVLLVNADPAFDGDRHLHGSFHRRYALGDELRLGHQAGAKPALLHPVGRAAGIEVDLAVAELLADACRARQRRRVTAAELQRDWLLGRIETKQPRAIAVQHRAGGQHLGIKQCPPRQEPMQITAMPVGPLHHRRDAKAPVAALWNSL